MAGSREVLTLEDWPKGATENSINRYLQVRHCHVLGMFYLDWHAVQWILSQSALDSIQNDADSICLAM